MLDNFHPLCCSYPALILNSNFGKNPWNSISRAHRIPEHNIVYGGRWFSWISFLPPPSLSQEPHVDLPALPTAIMIPDSVNKYVLWANESQGGAATREISFEKCFPRSSDWSIQHTCLAWMEVVFLSDSPMGLARKQLSKPKFASGWGSQMFLKCMTKNHPVRRRDGNNLH